MSLFLALSFWPRKLIDSIQPLDRHQLVKINLTTYIKRMSVTVLISSGVRASYQYSVLKNSIENES